MKNETTRAQSSPRLRLQNILGGNKKDYAITQAVTIGCFLLVTLIDISFSLSNHLLVETSIITGIFFLQILAIVRLPKNESRILNAQNVFLLSAAAIFAVIFMGGYSTGSYFYYFPAAIVFFLNTSTRSNKKRLFQFNTITLGFVIALIAHYGWTSSQNLPVVVSRLMAFRFGGALILSVVLVKHLFSLQAHIQHMDGRKEYHEALFQSYLDGYIIFNQETKEVIDYNKRMLSLFELPEDSNLRNLYMTQVMMRHLAEDSPNKMLMMDMIPDYWHGEAAFLTYKKEKFHSYVKSVVYYKHDIKYQILSIRDITNMKEAEKELIIYKESVEKAGRAKARFLSSMSHELRTPLNGIIGTSNLIKSETDLPASIQKHVDILLYSSEHMLGIINDILDFSKIDAGKLELKKQSFNVRDCINNIAGSFESQFKSKNIQLIIDQSPQLGTTHILSDELKLSQVIANLLSNALKFTLEGSVTFIVKVRSTTDRSIKIQFEVRDTGIGIAKEKQSEIFQGFSQVHAAELSRRFGGTGLGLSISEKLVTIFGGKLDVESEPGIGSRFHFTLTFETAEQKISSAPGILLPQTDIDIRGIRVLIVEDNLINATILKSFLKKWEIQIKEAENGVHALEMLKYHSFDLILMDLEMPEMDGYTAIKIIRKTDKVTPILAFTASLLENMETILTEAGFNDYVLKPYRPADLRAKIELYAPHRTIEYV